MQQKDFIYLFVGYIVMVGVLPGLEYCLSNGVVSVHESFQPVLFMSQSCFFGLMGYYLEHILDPKDNKVKIGLICIVLSLIALIITCVMTHFKLMVNGGESIENAEIFFNYFIAIPTITVYYLEKHLAKKVKGPKLRLSVTCMGSAVFGLYLIEKIIRALTSPVYSMLYPVVGSFIAALIWSFVVWTVGLIIVVLIKHTPVIKKVVNQFI